MNGKKRTEQKSGRRGRAPPTSVPQAQQRRFKAKTTPSQSWPSSNVPSSVFQNAASTAAGVAVGSVIGQAIGSTLAGNMGHVSSGKDSKNTSTHVQGICVQEIREFFECASRNEDLDTCKAFHNNWMKCQNLYKEQQS